MMFVMIILFSFHCIFGTIYSLFLKEFFMLFFVEFERDNKSNLIPVFSLINH